MLLFEAGGISMTTRAFPVLEQLERPESHEHTVIERVAASRKTHDVLLKALGTLGFSAIWGLCAGSARPMMALANVYKVPMVIALALLVSLPAMLATRHLLRIQLHPREIASALVVSLFRASLVLLGVAPLLGVYAYTTQFIAPLLAQGSAFLALAVGGFALQTELRRLPAPPRQLFVLGLVCVGVLALSLLQLITLATPVLTLPTAFGSGIEGMLR
jgi:hypothetical protein